MPRPRVMVYSSNLRGHRQVYCNAFIAVFLKLGYDILLVAGTSGEGGPFKYVEFYRAYPQVDIIDSCPLSLAGDGKLSIEQIVRLQKDHGVSVTLFTLADEMVEGLKAIGQGRAPRLHHRNIGVFLYSERWFPREVFFAPGLSLRTRLGNLRRRLQGNHEYYTAFFERTLQKERVLDAALVADERLVEAKGVPFYWFQDIYCPFAWEDDEESHKEYDRLVPEFDRFMTQQEDREVLLYFGMAAYRKGYDTLLNLALHDQGTCFVHCGAAGNGAENFTINVQAAKKELINQGRYFETGQWVNSWKAIERFWNAPRRFVLTRRDYRTSGTMLQALDAGKPVLAPNGGLIRHRILKNGLGELYRLNNFNHLLERWFKFKERSVAAYGPKIKTYMENYTREALVATFAKILN